MKALVFKFPLLVLSLLVMLSCADENDEISDQKSNTEKFAMKTFEVYEAVSSKRIPQEDIIYKVLEDQNGRLTARFKVIGESKKAIQMGSFVAGKSLNDGGTTCDGKWSCGKAIYECLENGQDALISEGACTSVSQEYCVTCQDP